MTGSSKLNMAYVNIVWFRRDLRLHDNHALSQAIQAEGELLPIFIFDPKILKNFPDKSDRRVSFIYRELQSIQEKFSEYGGSMRVFFDDPKNVFSQLLKEFDQLRVFSNEDYEPGPIKRDELIKNLCTKNKVEFLQFKDQVIRSGSEISKSNGAPYVVYTPYKKRWLEKLKPGDLNEHVCNLSEANYHEQDADWPTLEVMGYEKVSPWYPDRVANKEIIQKYAEQRDIPGILGTSQLGLHFRFGTVSIRKAVRAARKLSPVWLSELIWREFFAQILFHFPQVINQSFRVEYDSIQWRNNEDEIEAWKQGRTGYPMVDAGMRELNETGYMHNRVRMVVASFLCKHLLVDWRVGEEYFAQKLLDFDLASNNGNWQWAAGSGCDAAPYFRVFNPETQMKKFDPDLDYIKKWVPEFETDAYVEPIVDHKLARQRALDTYKEGIERGRSQGG